MTKGKIAAAIAALITGAAMFPAYFNPRWYKPTERILTMAEMHNLTIGLYTNATGGWTVFRPQFLGLEHVADRIITTNGWNVGPPFPIPDVIDTNDFVFYRDDDDNLQLIKDAFAEDWYWYSTPSLVSLPDGEAHFEVLGASSNNIFNQFDFPTNLMTYTPYRNLSGVGPFTNDVFLGRSHSSINTNTLLGGPVPEGKRANWYGTDYGWDPVWTCLTNRVYNWRIVYGNVAPADYRVRFPPSTFFASDVMLDGPYVLNLISTNDTTVSDGFVTNRAHWAEFVDEFNNETFNPPVSRTVLNIDDDIYTSEPRVCGDGLLSGDIGDYSAWGIKELCANRDDALCWGGDEGGIRPWGQTSAKIANFTSVRASVKYGSTNEFVGIYVVATRSKVTHLSFEVIPDSVPAGENMYVRLYAQEASTDNPFVAVADSYVSGVYSHFGLNTEEYNLVFEALIAGVESNIIVDVSGLSDEPLPNPFDMLDGGKLVEDPPDYWEWGLPPNTNILFGANGWSVDHFGIAVRPEID